MRSGADHRQRRGRHGEHGGQSGHAAEAVGQGAADGADHGAGEDAGGGEQTGGHRAEAVFTVEEDGQGRGQADEPAEGYGVEAHERPGVRLPQHQEVLGQRLRLGLAGAVLGQGQIDQEGDGQGERCEADHVAPSQRRGQGGCEEGGQNGPGVAGAGNAQRLALVLGRIPAGGQRQGDGEGGARHAQHHAEQQHLGETVDPDQPGGAQAQQHDYLGDQAGAAGLQVVHQHAHDHAEHRAGQGGNGHHQALLGGVEMKVLGDQHGQRAEQHPDHEAEVEIEEGREQGGRMPGFNE